ncbi:MAG: fibrobacter succinogenes major paralogous domain-containing protein [Fibrobacter sp.]|nr:fibrobacter succinogenes major paralogous domain-containing protein [Fibrobacter sp.]
MKKNFLTSVAFALALGLVACDDSTSANGSSGDENPAEVSSSSTKDFGSVEDLSSSAPSLSSSSTTIEDPSSSSSSVIASSSGTKQSSSSVIVSSSSSAPTEDPGSSSSVLSGGSAGVEGSSSSVTSSSSVESSSSVFSSSSEKSSSSVASSSSAKSSSSVASSSSMKAAWAYLNPDIDYGEFTDERDGQVYKTIKICDKDNNNCQTWMAENLNYDPDPEKVSSMGSYAWSGCYGNESANCTKYGRLYTWEVAMNDASCAYGNSCNPSGSVQGVCPSGWHLPSHREFETLINYIDPTFGYNHTDYASSSIAGKYLKSKSGWKSSGDGTDAYGFSALPGGVRNYLGRFFNDDYDAVRFWSSGEGNDKNAFGLGLNHEDEDADLHMISKRSAWSVRCLQD